MNAGGELDVAAMLEVAASTCPLLKACANPDRLLILRTLAGGEHNVAQLRQALGIAQPTLSQQLAVLRDHGLVATRREGKHIHYRVANPQAVALLDVVFRQYLGARQPPAPVAGRHHRHLQPVGRAAR